MAALTMKELLEAGVHFGHQTKRWNPKMQKYIFGERNGIYIIDLQKTLKKFREAYAYVRDLAAGGEIERLAQKDAAALYRLVVADEVCGRREPALAVLETALRNGYPLADVQRDPELLALRGDVRYHRLLVRLAPASRAA